MGEIELLIHLVKKSLAGAGRVRVVSDALKWKQQISPQQPPQLKQTEGPVSQSVGLRNYF